MAMTLQQHAAMDERCEKAAQAVRQLSVDDRIGLLAVMYSPHFRKLVVDGTEQDALSLRAQQSARGPCEQCGDLGVIPGASELDECPECMPTTMRRVERWLDAQAKKRNLRP